MMNAIRSSETLALSRATRHHSPEDGIPHSHRREILKYYNLVFNIVTEEWLLLGCYAVWLL
jgi:hypothetical protein